MGFVGGEAEEQICTFHGVLIPTLSFHAFAPPTSVSEDKSITKPKHALLRTAETVLRKKYSLRADSSMLT
jgi:hypothetical protein